MTAAKGKENWRTNVKAMDGLRRRYASVHPLIFQRTIERATSAGEAFDILEGARTAVFPLMWDDMKRQWAVPTDMWLEPGGQ